MRKQDQIHTDWEQIGRFLAGTLSDREQYCVERHFETCVGCRRNLDLRTRLLPFQPITLDGEPRLPGMTQRTLRCGWSRLIGPYLAGQMRDVEKGRLEGHLIGCESCGGQMSIHLRSLPLSQGLPFFYRLRRWLLRRSQ